MSGFSIKLNLSGKILKGKAGQELYRVIARESELVTRELESEIAQEMPSNTI